jgi:hypothetical protein
MSDAPRPAITRTILIAALITLVITGLRLLGEKEEWDPTWFSRQPGGGLALVGIAWLPILFGYWFGRQLTRAGSVPRSTRRALLLPVCGFVLTFVTGIVCLKVLKLEGVAVFYAFSAAAWVGALLALAAWPALFGVNLFYAVLARLPVIAVTWIAVSKGWDVHYAKMDPKAPALAGNELAFALTMAQVCFWIPYTIMVGGFFGGIAAAMRRK